jgi:hypothetical protein
MIYIWRGDLLMAQAIEAGRLLVDGTSHLRQAFSRWLSISPLAHVESMREDA